MNLILLILVIVGYLRMNLVHEELFYSEVQWKLVELDGLIEHQKKSDWSEPNLVTTQMSAILNGIFVAKSSGEYSGWISSNERMTMESLYAVLSRYPHDEIYKLSELTRVDKENFEHLQVKLQDLGFGMGMTISNDWKTFLNKVEQLIDLLRIQTM